MHSKLKTAQNLKPVLYIVLIYHIICTFGVFKGYKIGILARKRLIWLVLIRLYIHYGTIQYQIKKKHIE